MINLQPLDLTSLYFPWSTSIQLPLFPSSLLSIPRLLHGLEFGSQEAFLGCWCLSNWSLVWSALISTCHLHRDLADSIPNCCVGLNSEPSRKNFRKGSLAVVNCKINRSPSQGVEFPSPLVGFPLAMWELLGPDLHGQFQTRLELPPHLPSLQNFANLCTSC